MKRRTGDRERRTKDRERGTETDDGKNLGLRLTLSAKTGGGCSIAPSIFSLSVCMEHRGKLRVRQVAIAMSGQPPVPHLVVPGIGSRKFAHERRLGATLAPRFRPIRPPGTGGATHRVRQRKTFLDQPPLRNDEEARRPFEGPGVNTPCREVRDGQVRPPFAVFGSPSSVIRTAPPGGSGCGLRRGCCASRRIRADAGVRRPAGPSSRPRRSGATDSTS